MPTRRTHRDGGESRIGSRPAGMGGRWLWRAVGGGGDDRLVAGPGERAVAGG